MKENWGANFDTYYAKICEAVDSTKDEVMVYEGANTGGFPFHQCGRNRDGGQYMEL